MKNTNRLKLITKLMAGTLSTLMIVSTVPLSVFAKEDIEDMTDIDGLLDIKISESIDSDFNTEDKVLPEKKEENLISKKATYTSGDYEFSVSGTNATITSYLGNATTLTIPSTLKSGSKTYKVVGIGEDGFKNCETLKSIKVPSSVTSIGNYGFYSCRALTDITLTNNITSIGANAFGGCVALTEMTIPSGITIISESAFVNCIKLRSITIPNSVTDIKDRAFFGCNSLVNITIPDSVKSIGSSAFYICKTLTGLAIPNSITSIGENAFYGCEALTVYVEKDSYAENYCKQNSVPYEITSTYNVNFETGCDTKIDTKEIKYGLCIEEPVLPEKDGYEVTGWYTDEAYTNKWNFDTDTVKGDMTLYAKWEKKKVLVTSITLSAKAKTLTYGQVFNIKATVRPDNADNKVINWSSNNSKVILINNNKVMVKGCGKATVTATSTDGSNIKQNVVITVVPGKVKKLTLKAGKKKVTVTISKTAGAKKYEIYRSTKKNKGFKKVKTTTSRKWVNKGLKSKKTYYYKSRAINGSYKGAFSKVYKVKIK